MIEVSIVHSMLSFPSVYRPTNGISMLRKTNLCKRHRPARLYNVPFYPLGRTKFISWNFFFRNKTLAYRTHKCQTNMLENLTKISLNCFFFQFIFDVLLYENRLFFVRAHDLTNVHKHHKLHLHSRFSDHLLLFNSTNKQTQEIAFFHFFSYL